jgi:hypothetical protein
VGIDRPDDPDVPPDKHSDQPARRAPAETRSHDEYYADLRAAVVLRQRSDPGARSKTDEQTENDPQAQPGTSWEENAELSRWMWSEYKRRWPSEERPQVDRSNDSPGSWRGDRDRFLPSSSNAEVEEHCVRIADRERETVSPRVREVENCDPNRCLVGFEQRLKGRDRIKEKVADSIRLKHHTPQEAVALLPDAIRYTFQYDEARYTQGVRADIDRMKEQGFKLDTLKNSWSNDQYKGINSQWTDFDTGQRFEVQFHTRISFEAKQITHTAYERLRSKQADAFEELVLGAFQKKVAAEVPMPRGAAEIPDYPERGRNAG